MAGLGRNHPRRTDQPLARLPYLAVALAYGLLLFVGRRAAVYPLDGLILGAAAITARGARPPGAHDQRERAADVAPAEPGQRRPADRASRTGGRSSRRRSCSSRAPGWPSRRHSILMVDVDYFKEVNDTFGHRAGDRVLSVVASCVKSQLRSADLVGRYGGDELVIALADCDGPAAFAVAERIRSVVAATPVVFEEGVVNVTLSIGVAGGRARRSSAAGAGPGRPRPLRRQAGRAGLRPGVRRPTATRTQFAVGRTAEGTARLTRSQGRGGSRAPGCRPTCWSSSGARRNPSRS